MFISLYSCKKDYPKDTPKWLKEKIREYKKNEGYGSPEYIEEYKKDENIIYVFWYTSNSEGGIVYYNYSGNKICEEQVASFHCLIDSVPILNIYKRSREIWDCEVCE
jgi:hypothetical protein